MTGYVHELVEKDLDFNGWVWNCARAFGALISMRDSSMGSKIPKKLKPNSWYKESLQEDLQKLTKLISIQDDPVEVKKYADEHRETGIRYLREGLERIQKQNKKIYETIEKVETWIPPSSDHFEFKKFMREQLISSLSDDNYFLESISVLENKSDQEIIKYDIENAKSGIEYSKKQHAEALKRTEERNKWLVDLYNSVPIPDSMAADEADDL